MNIKNIKIVSNNIGYGLPPRRDEEVEQHLAIFSTGKVWCDRFVYGDGPGYGDGSGDGSGRELKNRDEVFIGEEAAARILEHIDSFVRSYQPMFITDVGNWQMEVSFNDGEKTVIKGPLIGAAFVEDLDLSEMIREEIPLEDLFIFG